mmetsp:Transcript_28999/g.55596  ORF Transcript_28999/g.55596 Transcript_28999/m.55596 type:complete len:240 (-) Transcript_28999:629-1348(-)
MSPATNVPCPRPSLRVFSCVQLLRSLMCLKCGWSERTPVSNTAMRTFAPEKPFCHSALAWKASVMERRAERRCLEEKSLVRLPAATSGHTSTSRSACTSKEDLVCSRPGPFTGSGGLHASASTPAPESRASRGATSSEREWERGGDGSSEVDWSTWRSRWRSRWRARRERWMRCCAVTLFTKGTPTSMACRPLTVRSSESLIKPKSVGNRAAGLCLAIHSQPLVRAEASAASNAMRCSS